jgi:hypothetical protein
MPYGYVILHCVCIPHFLDSFISCRAPGLFPKLVYCEECCNEHQCTSVYCILSCALWVHAQEWYNWNIWLFYL